MQYTGVPDLTFVYIIFSSHTRFFPKCSKRSDFWHNYLRINCKIINRHYLVSTHTRDYDGGDKNTPQLRKNHTKSIISNPQMSQEKKNQNYLYPTTKITDEYDIRYAID